MKTIKCDLCNRILGQQVDVGNFIGWDNSMYRPSDFSTGMMGMSFDYKTISDLCSECFNEIANAQKNTIEEIKGRII